MYAYDQFDRALVHQRVAQFRDQVSRRLSGRLSEEQFRPLRLMNGLYLQLHAYMLRVAIPYGTLSARQLRGLAGIARRFDRGYGHFTTRQNIQYNWIALEDAPDALAALAEVDMHAIQTSGNCIRNVTSDPFAGVAADEVEDARVWAEIVRQWSTLHPEFSFLPRKFKIAVSAAADDRAALRIHDIGLRLFRNDDNEAGFEVMAGGGLGRTPRLARTIRDFLPTAELLPYLESVLRVYNQHGRRDNIYKARIKILVDALGVEAFRDEVEADYAAGRCDAFALPAEEERRIRAMFAPPAYPALPAETPRDRAADPAFDDWVKANVVPHRVVGYAIAVISLKPVGGIPGDASADQMDAVADLAERYSFGEIRVTHTQNLILPHVAQRDLYALWQALTAHGLASANYGRASDIIACPGLDYCSLANARSIPVAQRIAERLAAGGREREAGTLGIKISGCINACGHHHVGDIGLLGVEKNGAEAYQMTLGGDAGDRAALGAIVGRAFSAEEVTDAVETVIDVYLARRVNGERLAETVRRIGLGPFKERLYGTDEGGKDRP
jgi:sulfite reductase (NADPH) hemoprotein beta-component